MAMSKYEPSLLSDYLLFMSREEGEVLTNLKLQKLLYYSQAWHLALYDTPIFDEDFQAWVHGPVLRSQYNRFREYRWQPIMAEIEKPEIPRKIKDHLDEILAVFGVETAIALESMTHQERPWAEARGDIPDHVQSQNIISKDSMREYYKSL